MIAWSDELSTGIAEVDHQHRSLVEAVAALHGAMLAGRTSGIQELVAALREYARSHFSCEERHMRELGFGGLARHAAEHARFVAELDRKVAAWRERGASASLSVEVADWLFRWLRDHVRGMDGEFGRFARRAGDEKQRA